MKRVQSSEAAENFDQWLDDSQTEPVVVQHEGRDAVVIISPDEFKRLSGGAGGRIDELHEKSMEKYAEVYRALAK